MPSFAVEIRGLKELQQALVDYPSISKPILQRTVETAAAILARHSQKGIVPWRTGFMRLSFGQVISELKAVWGPGVNYPVKYAIYVHEGTAPHVIEAKNKKVLANVKTGQVFGKRVNHPGTRPNRFMPRIAEQSKQEIDTLFSKALELIVKNVAAKAK